MVVELLIVSNQERRSMILCIKNESNQEQISK